MCHKILVHPKSTTSKWHLQRYPSPNRFTSKLFDFLPLGKGDHENPPPQCHLLKATTQQHPSKTKKRNRWPQTCGRKTSMIPHMQKLLTTVVTPATQNPPPLMASPKSIVLKRSWDVKIFYLLRPQVLKTLMFLLHPNVRNIPYQSLFKCVSSSVLLTFIEGNANAPNKKETRYILHRKTTIWCVSHPKWEKKHI